MIRLEDVRWVYEGGDAAVLDGVDLRIERGETVVLCGRSGSGKSSVLRLMNGLIPHFHAGTLHGRVSVGGAPITELAQVGRVTGSVLQHPRRQFFTDAVDTELALALENFGTPPPRIRERVGAVIAEFGLGDLTGRLRELSGGQQQRVACAGAVAHEPALVLLDEPTSNLSAAAIADLGEMLRHLKERGATLVIAEHRLHYLRDLADRLVLLEDGRVGREWGRDDFADLTEERLREAGLRSLDAPQSVAIPTAFARGLSVAPAVSRAEDAVATKGVALRDIRCGFRGRPILDIAETHLPAGVITAVTGPNGVGKSTMARILAGLQRHAGEVFLDGRKLSRARRQRESAIVMQDVQRQLFTDSVTAELRLGTRGDRAEIGSALSDLDLAGLGDRHPLALSGGQQQRLAIAVAGLSGRRIVIFDEPSSGVDRRHLRRVTRAMRDVAAGGAVVLLISHDTELLAHAADQELRLRPIG